MRHCQIPVSSPCQGPRGAGGAGESQLGDLHGGSVSRASLEISAGISSPLSSWHILLFGSQKQDLPLL